MTKLKLVHSEPTLRVGDLCRVILRNGRLSNRVYVIDWINDICGVFVRTVDGFATRVYQPEQLAKVEDLAQAA